MTDKRWKRLDRDSIEGMRWDHTYDNCSAGFVCSCGREVNLESQGGPNKCECGRRFQIVVRIEELIEDTDD